MRKVVRKVKRKVMNTLILVLIIVVLSMAREVVSMTCTRGERIDG